MRLALLGGTAAALLLVTSAGATAPNAGRGTDPYLTTGALGYDVLHYDVSLTYDQRRHGLGTSTAQVFAVATTTLTSFTMDMGPGLTVVSVKVNDAPARWSHPTRKLGVTPAATLPAHRQFRVLVTYRGVPRSHPDTSLRGPVGWQQTRGGAVTYTEPDGTHEWVPSKDVLYDKATWRVRLTTPRGYLGVSTGRYRGLTQTSTTNSMLFTQDQPITPYQQVVAFDRFSTSAAPIEGHRAFVAVTQYGGVSVAQMQSRTAQALRWLTPRLGAFPYPDTGAIVVSGGDSAMETAGRPTYSNDSSYYLSTPVVVHELAHQWFGGRLTARNTSDLWLHEAFATWLELHWAASQPGGEPRADAVRRRYLSDGFTDASAGQFGRVSVEAPTNRYRLESTPYYRGAAAVEALRTRLGASGFDALLRGVGRLAAGRVFTTSAFVALAQQLTGQDLSSWRATWISSKAPQVLPTAPTHQQLADELALRVGIEVYAALPETLTPELLPGYVSQAKVDYPGWVAVQQLLEPVVSGTDTVSRVQLSAPAGGPYATPVTVCATFPRDLQRDGKELAWWLGHATLSDDFAPDTVTIAACPV